MFLISSGVLLSTWFIRLSQGVPLPAASDDWSDELSEGIYLQEPDLVFSERSGLLPAVSNLENDKNENMAAIKDLSDAASTVKRSFFTDRNLMIKRIHTCAFMRRLGLPIGLCFSGSRSRVPTETQHAEPAPSQTDPYAYLEDHWPVHSLLGGGVGR